MARNRYGWQKRAKELARKQKHDDKLKRRQGKALTPETEETAGAETAADLEGLPETGPEGEELPAGSSQPE